MTYLDARAEARTEERYICSDLAEVHTKTGKEWHRQGMAVLEDVSTSGACIQVEAPLLEGTHVELRHEAGQLRGKVRYCIMRDDSYFAGIQLAESSKWSYARYRPKHMLESLLA